MTHPAQPPHYAAHLTDLEIETLELLGRVANNFTQITDHGRTRNDDLREAVAHIHSLQHAVMAQAAARAYPHLFRKLGSSL